MLFRRRLVVAATGTAVILCVVVWAASRTTAAQIHASQKFDFSPAPSKNRFVFVFAPSAKNKAFKEQENLWRDKEAGFADRNLIPYFILEKGQSRRGKTFLPTAVALNLRRTFYAKAGEFSVILVGKDRNIAFSSSRPVTLPALFGRIDTMPMRRDEMRRKAGGKKR